MTGPMTLLVGLLLLSYVGSSVGRDSKFRVVTRSGIEHIVLGLVLGPLLLGIIERSWTKLFEPIVLVGAAWLGFVAGVRWRAPAAPHWVGPFARGIGFGVVTLGAVLGAFVLAWKFGPEGLAHPTHWNQWVYVVLGVLMTLPIATPASMSSVLGRITMNDATRSLLAGIAAPMPFFPLIAAMIFFGMSSQWLGGHRTEWVVAASLLVPIVVGVVLGLVAAGLLSRFVHAEQAWGVILGTTLLGAGFSIRLGTSAVATLFFLGLTVSRFSSLRSTLSELVEATERPILLPVALLLGAALRADVTLATLALFGGVWIVRTLIVQVAGSLASIGLREAKLGYHLGYLLTMPAALPLALRSEVSVRSESPFDVPLLALACLGLASHELLGQLSIRRLDVAERQSQLPPTTNPAEGTA